MLALCRVQVGWLHLDSNLERMPWLTTGGGVAGHCYLWRGRVFARSHAHETTLPWFSAAKQIARDLFLRQAVPDHIALFVENLEAIHSIDYGSLRESPIYIIGALDMSQGDVFLS